MRNSIRQVKDNQTGLISSRPHTMRVLDNEGRDRSHNNSFTIHVDIQTCSIENTWTAGAFDDVTQSANS